MTSSIDITAIDATKPIHGNPTTASVRDNTLAIKTALGVAKTEIEAGQAADVVLQNLITGLQSSKLDASAYNQHFQGVYSTLSALQSAYPTAIAGDYAQVDAGSGEHLQTYMYDLQDGWVLSSAAAVSILNTDQLTEGAANLYFTNARAILATLSGFVTTGDVTASDSLFSAIQKITATIEILKSTLHITNYATLPVPPRPYIVKAEGEEVVIDAAAGFTSQQTLTYSAMGLPTGLSIDPTTGYITGTIGAIAAGSFASSDYVVAVRATATDTTYTVNLFVLTVLKTGYDFLCHFESYPLIDSTGKCEPSSDGAEYVSAHSTFGSWGYRSRVNITRYLTIPNSFTVKVRVKNLSSLNTGYSRGSAPLSYYVMYGGAFESFIVKILSYSAGTGIFNGILFTTTFTDDLAISVEKHTDNIIRLYINGAVVASFPHSTSIEGSGGSFSGSSWCPWGVESDLVGHVAIDEAMLLIGTAQAGGANSYVVETVPFS